jgi:magnesium transporter
LLGYKDKTAGGIMTSEVTTVTPGMSVADVIEYLRGEASEFENIYYVYVVDGDRRLLGVVSLRDLIVSAPASCVEDIYTRDVITVDPDDDQEEVADTMSKYDLLALPVVDESGVVLGMVTVDDALDVMEEESAEDLEIATGRGPGQIVLGLTRWVSRDGWLPVWALLILLPGLIERGLSSAGVIPPGLLGLPLLLVALTALPLLRYAEDTGSHAVSRAIESEDDEERPAFWRRFARDGGVGALFGVAGGLIAFTAADLVVQAPGSGPIPPQVVAFGVAVGLTVLVTTVAGTATGRIAETRARSERKVSQAAVSVTLMVFTAIAYLGLLALALFVVLPRLGA